MVYLISGKGVVSINGNRMAYRDGNLLLLTPNDRHNWQSPQQVFQETKLHKPDGLPRAVSRQRPLNHFLVSVYYSCHSSTNFIYIFLFT